MRRVAELSVAAARELHGSARVKATRRLLLLLGAGVVASGLAVGPFAKAHLQAVALLDNVSGKPAPWAVREFIVPVTKRDVTFAVEGPGGLQQVRARLYQPVGGPNAPAMVIFHGVHHLGIDEPRMMGFAAAMASCGIRVLTPELPGIKDYHVSQDSVATIGESVKWMAAQTGGPVGVMGLSFAGGLALVADADPKYHADFKFVLAVGAQDSMARVAEYYLTGKDARPDGTVETLAAHEYGPLVLEYEHLDQFVPAADLGPVRAVLRAHLYEDKKAETEASLELNEQQKLETLELMDTTLPATRTKIRAMLTKYTDEMPELSPDGRLKTLGTPVYLLHGEADNVIPSAETLWAASELRPADLQAMLVSPVLSHVDVGLTPGAKDKWQLVHFFALVLRAAERRR